MPSGVAIVGNRSNEVGPKNQGADKEIAILRGNHRKPEKGNRRKEAEVGPKKGTKLRKYEKR